jgi:hypothetical protein
MGTTVNNVPYLEALANQVGARAREYRNSMYGGEGSGGDFSDIKPIFEAMESKYGHNWENTLKSNINLNDFYDTAKSAGMNENQWMANRGAGWTQMGFKPGDDLPQYRQSQMGDAVEFAMPIATMAGMAYGGNALFGPGGALSGGASTAGKALGSGLTMPSNAGAIMGTGGASAGASGLGGALGTGITPGAAASGLGGGALGTGIGAGAIGAGSLGALDFANMNFSPAAMQALSGNIGGTSLPSLGGNASGGASTPGMGGGSGLRLPSSAAAGGGAPVSSAAAPAAGAPPVAGEPSFVDKLIKQMKDNALGLGLAGAGTLMSAKGAQRPMPNQEQLQGLGGEAAATAQQLMQQYRTGQLSTGQQANLDQLTQQTKNQITQYFSSIGQADSTAHMQAIAQVDQQALGMKQQMLDNALTQGFQAIGVATGPLSSVAQYQLGQDQQLSQAFGNFAGAMGNLFGRQAGQPTQTEKPRQQEQVVTSTQ